MKSPLTTVYLTVRTLFCYLLTGCFGIMAFLPCLLCAALMPAKMRYRSALLFGLIYLSYQALLKGLLLKIRVQGRENLPAGPVIFVANHESSIDIPLLGSLLGGAPHLWYAYKRFFSTPILGFLLRRIAISVDDEHPIQGGRALIKGMNTAKQYQLPILLFPEGGRYTDPEVHAFFSGFAMLSKKLGYPVVPVIIKGAGRVYPKSSFFVYPHTIDMYIGKPFYGTPTETNAEFTERVRAWFVSEQGKNR